MLKAPVLECGRFLGIIKRAALAVGLLSLVGSAAAQIAPSLVPSRLSGVAPLFVFFDATGTTDPGTPRPFHDLDYRWNFGDPASGNWISFNWAGTGPRNEDKGPVAGHVFETPGTRTVNLSVHKDGGTTGGAAQSVQITVQDPNVVFSGSNTLCVGNTLPVAGSGGCPAGAAVHASSDFAAEINDNIATHKRILFRRGDTFTSSEAAEIQVDGPGLIGAFGSGAAPVVNISNPENAAIALSSRDTPDIKDWRIMDLEINGNSGAASYGIVAGGGIDQVTLLRVNIHHVHNGLHLSPDILTYYDPSGTRHKLWDEWAVVDSTVRNAIGGQGGYVLYFAGQRTALMGNVLSDSSAAEHVLRTPYVYKGVISHNDMSKPASGKHVVKMQSTLFSDPFPAAPTRYTEQIFFSDNKFTSGDGGAWTVTLGPMNGESDERVKQVILERNWFAPHPAQDQALTVWSQDVTVRNNLFNLTGTAGGTGIVVERRGPDPQPMPANVHVYNNTFYSGSSGGFQAMWFSSTAGSGHIVRNNLAYAPNASPAVVIQDNTSGAVTASHNTGDAQIPTSPSFFSASPVVPADFRLTPGSYALESGTTVPVYKDYFGNPRPGGLVGDYDLGFDEL